MSLKLYVRFTVCKFWAGIMIQELVIMEMLTEIFFMCWACCESPRGTRNLIEGLLSFYFHSLSSSTSSFSFFSLFFLILHLCPPHLLFPSLFFSFSSIFYSLFPLMIFPIDEINNLYDFVLVIRNNNQFFITSENN